MIGYIYFITNKINGKKYIGKTNDIERRVSRHFSDLKSGSHHSHKLQRAFNKYGKENFVVTYEIYTEITEEALKKIEIDTIKREDSYYNGYNETFGGDGNTTLFDFETSVLIHQIGKRYEGVIHTLSRYFNCDRTTISNIFNRESLDIVHYNEEKLQELIKKIGLEEKNLKGNYKNNYSRKLTEEQVFMILSTVELKQYTRASCARAVGVSKDVVNCIFEGRTYKDEYKKYQLLTLEQKSKYANKFCKTTEVNKYAKDKKATTVKITQDIVNYILDNKDNMTQKAIGDKLGIDRKRVARIIHKESYLDLIKNWEIEHSSN